MKASGCSMCEQDLHTHFGDPAEDVMADIRAALAADPTVCRVAGRRGKWHRADRYSGWFDCGIPHHAGLLCQPFSATPSGDVCRRCHPHRKD